MNDEQVVGLVRDMKGHRIRLVAGGWLGRRCIAWGTDPRSPRLGRTGRCHRPRAIHRRLHELGFQFAYAWEETTDVRDSAWHKSGTLPTAFVYVHRDGREIDTHVLGNAEGENPEALWSTTFVFTKAGLGVDGVIAGEPVRCISAELQRLAHQGYEAPRCSGRGCAAPRDAVLTGRPPCRSLRCPWEERLGSGFGKVVLSPADR